MWVPVWLFRIGQRRSYKHHELYAFARGEKLTSSYVHMTSSPTLISPSSSCPMCSTYPLYTCTSSTLNSA